MQLFNAVQKHQKNVDEKVKEAGSSVRKRAKLMAAVSKKDFISVLRGLEGGASQKGPAGRTAEARQVRPLLGFGASGRWLLHHGVLRQKSTLISYSIFRFYSSFRTAPAWFRGLEAWVSRQCIRCGGVRDGCCTPALGTQGPVDPGTCLEGGPRLQCVTSEA